MKKIYFIFFIFLISFKNASSIETIAKQAILYDMDTKSVIFKKNSDQLVSPSSMSKIMTIYYVFKKISSGELSLDDEFVVSKKAWKKGGSKMFVNLKSKVRVEDLIRGIIVQSGNDAHVMKAWGEQVGALGKIAMLADSRAELAQALGVTRDFGPVLGERAKRCGFIADKGIIIHSFIEEPGQLTGSSAEAILEALQ